MKKKEPTHPNLNEPETPARSARALARYVRISPRKVRLVINTIRHQPTEQAFGILMSLKQKAARLTEKLLKSAVANAKVLGLDENRLYVCEVRADGGPSLKRFMQRSMGRADRILKRTTHLSLAVAEAGKNLRSPEQALAKENQKEKTKEAKAGSSKMKKAASAAV